MLGAIVNNRAPVNESFNSNFVNRILQPLTRLERVWIVVKGLFSSNPIKFHCEIKYKLKNVTALNIDAYHTVQEILLRNQRQIRPSDIEAFEANNWQLKFSLLNAFV